MGAGYLGVLPDFVIIGAQRCGTTSLYSYLTEHPNVMRAARKEIHFFDNNYGQSLRWYRSQMPASFRKYITKSVYRQDIITGEASPYYLFHPQAFHRMWKIIPRAKLLVLLRNPVDRAYSHYNHNIKRGREKLSFEEAIAGEVDRLDGELEKMRQDPTYSSFDHQHYSYLSRGIYVDQLRRWMGLFPEEQFLILQSEGFFANPDFTLEQVLEFLELPSFELKEFAGHNAITYSKMKAGTRSQLLNFFQPHNQRLFEFLGIDFSWDS